MYGKYPSLDIANRVAAFKDINSIKFCTVLLCQGAPRDWKLVGPKNKFCWHYVYKALCKNVKSIAKFFDDQKKKKKVDASNFFSHFLTPNVAPYILLPGPSGPLAPPLGAPGYVTFNRRHKKEHIQCFIIIIVLTSISKAASIY